jgi:mannose-6-phosphate isomerase-like protein (cupin superfamily)
MDPVEKIMDGADPIAYIIHSSYQPKNTEFLTPDSFTQQLGFITYPDGHQIPPHVHRPLQRVLTNTAEVLLVRSGRLKVDLYSTDRRFLTSRDLHAGDVILLIGGGHGFQMFDNCVLLEVKQGPYIGQDEKVRFTP